MANCLDINELDLSKGVVIEIPILVTVRPNPFAGILPDFKHLVRMIFKDALVTDGAGNALQFPVLFEIDGWPYSEQPQGHLHREEYQNHYNVPIGISQLRVSGNRKNILPKPEFTTSLILVGDPDQVSLHMDYVHLDRGDGTPKQVLVAISPEDVMVDLRTEKAGILVAFRFALL